MSQVWVGLTEVSKAEECELDFQGVAAFVWWASQADSEELFLAKLKDVLAYYKLVLIEVTGVRRFEETDDVSDELFGMVERVRANKNWTLGTFFSYPHHNA